MKNDTKLKAKDFLLLAVVAICIAASLLLYLDKNFLISQNEDKNENIVTETKSKAKVEKLDGGKVIIRMFFDENDNPLKTKGGSYGYISEKNDDGKLIRRTFVDENKNPVNIRQGYSIIEYSYYDNNTVTVEMYFDADGNPARMPNGSYGLKRQDGKIFYLDQNKEVIFNIENIATRFPVAVVIAGVLLCLLLIIFRNKKPVVILFIIAYLIFIIYITLFRPTGKSADITQFSTYRGFFTSHGARVEILNNIWLFAPLGAALWFISHKRWVAFLPILLSILIEFIQLIFGLGVFQIDDIISNTIGTGIGFLSAYVFERFQSSYLSKFPKT